MTSRSPDSRKYFASTSAHKSAGDAHTGTRAGVERIAGARARRVDPERLDSQFLIGVVDAQPARQVRPEPCRLPRQLVPDSHGGDECRPIGRGAGAVAVHRENRQVRQGRQPGPAGSEVAAAAADGLGEVADVYDRKVEVESRSRRPPAAASSHVMSPSNQKCSENRYATSAAERQLRIAAERGHRRGERHAEPLLLGTGRRWKKNRTP